MPSKKKKEVTESTSGTQRASVAMTEEEAKAATSSSAQPVLVISSVDNSLINAQAEILTREQINDLRRKLKAKFH